jgi:O-6-methylguanine DNA methyltransferase
MILHVESFAVPRFGPIIIGVTETGLRFLRFGPKSSITDAHEYAAKNKMETTENSAFTKAIREHIQEYFNGNRKQFNIVLDIEHLDAFAIKVLRATQNIPYGHTVSYGELAKQVNSTAYRAIGKIMANNPIPIVIPCHRVIGANGKLTGFSLGLATKRQLLDFESSQLKLLQ